MQTDSQLPKFQSTLSMRRATIPNVSRNGRINISIHALHEESDARMHPTANVHLYFNPRSP